MDIDDTQVFIKGDHTQESIIVYYYQHTLFLYYAKILINCTMPLSVSTILVRHSTTILSLCNQRNHF